MDLGDLSPLNPYPRDDPLWAHWQNAAGLPMDEPEPDGKRLRITLASAIRVRPVQWLWQGWIPTGAVTLMPGREGIGKSLALVWLTARITRGEQPGKYYGTPKAVIYAATEDSWERTIVPRLIVAGADLDLVIRVDVFTEDYGTDALTLPRDCRELEQIIKERNVVLIALDPLMSVIDINIDTYKDRELRTALEPLTALADRTNAAFVGLAHFNKSNGTDPLSLVTGSRAFTAVIRAAIGVVRDPDADDGSCIVSLIKNNLGRLDVPSLRYIVESAELHTEEGPAYVGKLVFMGESERGVHEILQQGNGGDKEKREEERLEKHACAEWLSDYMVDNAGECNANDAKKIGAAHGFSPMMIDRARWKVGVTTHKLGFGKDGMWVWRLKLGK